MSPGVPGDAPRPGLPDEPANAEPVLDPVVSGGGGGGGTKPCPFCGEPIQAAARKCRFCGEYLDPTLKPKPASEAGELKYLIPVNRPVTAIAAGYLGLISLFPCIGMITCVPAIILGCVALSTLKKKPEMNGRGRAIFGIAAGGLCALGHLGWFAFALAVGWIGR